MDAKYKDDVFRKYVQFHESKLNTSDKKQHSVSDECLQVTASTLLCFPKIDPFYRFRLIKFYEIVENSLRSLKSSSLRSLQNAFGVLESVGVNLFLYPWKKEFKNIKTYTGPFVYYVKSTIPDEDIRQILNSMGYIQELGTMYKLKDMVDTLQVKMVSFELFLAKLECEQLIEIHLQVKDKGYTELDIVNERKNSSDVRGCSDALKRRAECKENLNTSMSRMVLQKSASERGCKDYFKPKVSKASKSVDAYDSYLENKKPPLMTSLSLRKEPILVDTEDDIKDEIIRPSPSLLAMSSSPHGCSDEYLPVSSHTNGILRTGIPYSTYYSPQDDLDLYTDSDSRSMFKRQEPTKHDVWLLKNDANPTYHKRTHLAKDTTSLKCQNCGLSCGTSICQKCDNLLICRQEYPPMKQSSYSLKTLASEGISSGSVIREKPQYMLQTQDRVSQYSSKSKPSGSSRCGFCNRPGATNTCTFCSKVSCDPCLTAYYYDPCCRKSELHRFLPNNQLNYKSNQLPHMVYR
ncbi:spermatogenesis-associated protein 2 [Podarcis raffonei]|uniref:spermatogenesis-associated protein 2 n=1 Tax=Podarcis raffonei TaxID=65483 RepID=UPI00232988A2|nr:spermatogenesis-associated protein 2 [Podarcis raffonei]XP_053250198.1 spermatogenesis-associated protein 2 [Podarcis raffonei]XP_053250199.1 spermatogenesis-associated protein 2 [Podarcis raffonei]XP_053250200.1 spermatogenesis-associated protein 2 [Podarcis raffonei]XP_053250201.1 spermatogenesis-associated protein 2 [Podarcis raffonei]XP_053250202.1 spermatogenesis-associated protein 2 [Podarcis raffonei]XP_053250204.1 spermatogenesis-associated protein 2 [Podarcis raffonei]XP_05325020